MSSSKMLLFGPALVISVVKAWDDIESAMDRLSQATQLNSPISPNRRFNLESVLEPIPDEIPEDAIADLEGNEYWEEPDGAIME